MDDFITYLDDKYADVRRKEKIPPGQRDFSVFFPAVLNDGKAIYKDFLIKKERMTQFLYTKKKCRIYFSDEDIVSMLLQVNDENVLKNVIVGLRNAYKGIFAIDYTLTFNNKIFNLSGLAIDDYSQELVSEQDVSCDFKELMTLVNLILAKDYLGTNMPMWSSRPSFIKHTCCKYIALLEYYYFNNSVAKEYLDTMGYNINGTVHENYSTPQMREEKSGFFKDFVVFEKAFNI